MFNQTSANSIVIRRQRKQEAERAIADLEKRGYELVHPLTEQSHFGKTFSTDGYRKLFVENTHASCWMAKLRRVAE